MREGTASFLQVRDLSVRFRPSGVGALDGISFDLNEGEALGVLGESGAGKTTLAKTLLRLHGVDADIRGSVRFRGIEILRASDRSLSKIRGASISLISQEPELGLNPFIRVGDQVAEVLRAHSKLSKRELQRLAREMLESVGLGDREIRLSYPHQLSGGQQQRVVIAQALVCKPALLMADEPTSAMDNVTQAEILSLVKELRRRFALALIFITHDHRLLGGLAERVLIMRAGRIVQSGTLREVLAAEGQDPYTDRLMKFAPSTSASDACK